MIAVAALSFGIDCYYDEIRDLPSLIFFMHENNSHLLLCVIYLKMLVIFNVHGHRTLLLKTYHMRVLHIYRMFNVPIGVNTFISWQDRHLFTMNAQQILSFVLTYTICYHLYSPFNTPFSGILLANILQFSWTTSFPSVCFPPSTHSSFWSYSLQSSSLFLQYQHLHSTLTWNQSLHSPYEFP